MSNTRLIEEVLEMSKQLEEIAQVPRSIIEKNPLTEVVGLREYKNQMREPLEIAHRITLELSGKQSWILSTEDRPSVCEGSSCL